MVILVGAGALAVIEVLYLVNPLEVVHQLNQVLEEKLIKLI